MPIPPETTESERCSAWCDGTFCTGSELPRDRMHHSRIAEVAGVVRTRWLDPADGCVVRGAEPVMMNVLASRYLDEHRTWVVITTDERSLEISVETAIELHVALGALLQQLGV